MRIVSELTPQKAGSIRPQFAATVQRRVLSEGGVAEKFEDVVILGGARTPFGKMGGSLKDVTAFDLLKIAMKGALDKSGVKPEDVNQVIMGNIIANDEQNGFLHRSLGLALGIPRGTIAHQMNRLCGTGFEVAREAANQLANGGDSIILTGGVENMSRTPVMDSKAMLDAGKVQAMQKAGVKGKIMALLSMPGLKFRTPSTFNPLQKGLTDPLVNMVMYNTADELAARAGITRAEADAFSAESQRRAGEALKAGRFNDEIVAVRRDHLTKGSRLPQGTDSVTKDEHLRPGTTAEKLGKLSVLDRNRKDAITTAGNASGVVDGAAAVAMTTGAYAKEKNLAVLAQLKSVAVTGVDPKIMGFGPKRAIEEALKSANLTMDQVDVVEINEAFAGQALAVARALSIPLDKLNPDGGAIAIGHPLAASGSRILVHTANRLKATGQRYAVVSACIGGGQGIAAVIENPNAKA